jgi:23S rRNA maturation-related 3'-5' exoribonuclease YhaM
MDTQTQRIQKFIDLFSEVFPEDTTVELMRDLKNMGFFDAPASTKYHGNYPGGLFEHSYMVTIALLSLTKKLNLYWKRPASPYLVGMLHDLCKTDQYVQKEDGTYEYAKNLPLTGHGDKSVILAQKLTFLTDEEVLCIRWHMGAYDEKENWNALGAAIEKYPNVLYTHTADMIASRIHGV